LTPPVCRDDVVNAIDALEKARQMPRGPERIQALREAGLLRYAADRMGLTVTKDCKGSPP